MDIVSYVLAKKYADDSIANITERGQADWSQDDETAIDFIKNKPFGVGSHTLVIPASGDEYGRITDLEFAKLLWEKKEVAKYTLHANNLIAGDYAYEQFEQNSDVKISIIFNNGRIRVSVDIETGLIVASINGTGFLDFTISIPEVNTIDDKFIPDSIARKVDIPVAPVTSVNGMTGDVVIEIGGGSGSGGVSNWNDLTNKPFYDVNGSEKILPDRLPDGGVGWTEIGETIIEWDGSIEGLDVVAVGDMTLVWISGLLPSVEAMIGCTVEMADVSSYEINAETIYQVGPIWVVYAPVGDDLLPILYGVGATEYQGISFPATGLYAVLYPDQPYRFSRVTITDEIVHQLDEKFIPDWKRLPNPNKLIFNGAARGEYDGSEEVTIEIPEGFSGSWDDLSDRPLTNGTKMSTIEWDGTHTGVTYPSSNLVCKVSDLFSPDMVCVGFTLSDGRTFSVDAGNLSVTESTNNTVYSGDDKYGYCLCVAIVYDTPVTIGNRTYDVVPGVYLSMGALDTTVYKYDAYVTEARFRYTGLVLADDVIPDSVARKTDIPELDATLTKSGAAADAAAVGAAIERVSGQNLTLDTTLTQSGKAADAGAVGDKLTELEEKIQEGGSEYTLPVANASTLGGVKAQAKTAAMTQPVGVDANGNLYTLPPAQNTTNVDGVSFTHHAGNLFDGNEYRGAMPVVGDDVFFPAGTSSHKYIVFRAKPNTEYFVTMASDFNPEGVGQADGAGRCTTEIVSFESADSVVSYVEWKKRTGGLGYYIHFKTNERFREDTAYLIYKIVRSINLSDLLVFEGTSIEEYATVAEYSPMNGTDTSDTMLIQEKNLTKGINDKLNQAVSAVQPEHLKPTAYPWTPDLPGVHHSFPVLNASAIGDFAKLCNSARICAADNNHLKLNTIYAHCPTIKIIDGIVYAVAFQNASNSDFLKDATIELFRANVDEWAVIDQTNVAAAGLACGAETLTDGCIDPNMLNIDNQTLRITFTTRFADGGHRMCYRDYDIASGTFGDIGLCKISDGVTVYDFDIPGIKATCGDFTAANPQIYMATQYATFNSEYYIALSLGTVYKDAPILKTADFITFTHWKTPVVEGNNMQYECALVACRTAWGQDFLYSATRQYKDAFNEDSRRMLVSRIALTDGSVIRSVWVPDGNIRPFWHTSGETAYLWHTLETNRTCSTITSFPFNTNTLLPDSIGTAADTAAMIYATAEAYENDLIVCYMRKGGLFISRIPKVDQYGYGDVIPMLEKFLDFFGTK